MTDKIKKPIYKRGWFIALAILIGIGGVGAISSGEMPTERVETELAQKEQNTPQKEQKKSRDKIGGRISPTDSDWNTESLLTNENGNVERTAKVLNKMSQEGLNQKVLQRSKQVK